MRPFLGLLVTLVCVLTAPKALATYVIADLDSTNADPSMGTHVLIAGQGLEDGRAWLNAAQTQALVFKDRGPHGYIRLIAAVDPKAKQTYLDIIQSWGYENIHYTDAEFNSKELTKALAALPLIASIDFNGHDGAFLGLALQDEDTNHRFYLNEVSKAAGQLRFSNDAYIRLMGCNTGWFLAPYMAKKWGVPVAGTLTAADIEIMSSENDWFYDEDSLWPKQDSPAKDNKVSFSEDVPCVSHAGCIRLKPINGSYNGQHGAYAGALPFMKYFCGTVQQSDCFRRMALSTRTLVGVNSMSSDGEIPTPAEFAATLADQFCSGSYMGANRKNCQKAIADHVLGRRRLSPTFTTLSSDVPSLSCTFTGCQFKVVKDPNGGNVLAATGDSVNTTFVDELNAYIAGYRSL